MGRVLGAFLAVSLACCMVPSAALASGGECTVVGETSQPAGLTAQATKASAGSKWVVKTKEYRFTIPKYWRGKVQWKTTSYRWQNNVGKWRKSYTTTVYLKGHKGDSRYEVASIIGGVVTGFGGETAPVISKKMKRQDHPYFTLYAHVFARNLPYMIWADANSSYYSLSIPTSDQKKLLKLVTGGKVPYSKMRSASDYPSSATKKVAGYLKPHFKKSLKVLS